MALKKNHIKIISTKEVIFEDAYHRISYISGNKERITFVVSIYANENITPETFIESIEYTFVPSEDENSIRWDKQAYAFLKTKPEYEDAMDILEEWQLPIENEVNVSS